MPKYIFILLLILVMEVDEKAVENRAETDPVHTLRLLNENMLAQTAAPDSSLCSTSTADPQSLRPSNNKQLKTNLLIISPVPVDIKFEHRNLTKIIRHIHFTSFYSFFNDFPT
jgi:hypothetical protein